MRIPRVSRYLGAALVGLSLAACAAAPSLASVQTFEQGQFSFESYQELSWAEILQKRLEGKQKVQIPAELMLPKTVAGRVPAMVIMHGSGGLRQREYRYARELNKEGIGAVVLDSFNPRGVATTGGQQERVTTSTMLGDVYALLNLLQNHPKVDPDRIGIMGFSKGGSVTVFAVDEQIRSALASGTNRFALGVAFYPACVTQLRRVSPTGAPLFMLLGEQDSYVPAVQCERYIEKMKAAGFSVTAIKYADAHHGWDSSSPVRFLEFDYSYGKCSFEVDEAGVAVDLNSRLPVTSVESVRKAIKSCGTWGVWVGGNEEATRKSLADLTAILKRAFAR